MTEAEIKLQHVLQDNDKWPLIIIGMKTLPENSVVLAADIDERELIKPSGWEKIVDHKSRDKKVYLVIENIDKIALSEQEKFLVLLKERSCGSCFLPKNVQILVTADNKAMVNRKIQSLSLLWEVK